MVTGVFIALMAIEYVAFGPHTGGLAGRPGQRQS